MRRLEKGLKQGGETRMKSSFLKKGLRTAALSAALAAAFPLCALPVCVTDFGAKGDGVTDDTAAIQAAIDATIKRGGGKITFPYTPNGYRIASPGRETVDGHPCRAQLCLPARFTN